MGRVIKRGLQLWHLDSGFCKGFVYARIEPPEGQPDLWHLPEDITENYCKQVTAEAIVHKPSGQSVWVRNRKDNHKLDCEGMQVAAAYMFGLHKKRRPKHMQKQEAEPPKPTSEEPDKAPAANIIRKPRKRRRTIHSPSLR